MGHMFWITSVFAAGAVIYGLNENAGQAQNVSAAQIAQLDEADQVAVPNFDASQDLPEMSQHGSALATAAFGMSALQPETYNGDMVANIIAASPLEEVEKVQLTANLEAAETGEADLHRVLSDVRSALAVD